MNPHLTYQPARVQKASPKFPLRGNQIKEAYRNDTDAENQQHFVFWSGGCDSTLLLYELIDTYGADHVTAISYRFPWLLDIKAESEKEHRELFMMKMRNKGPHYYPFNCVEMDVRVTNVIGEFQTHPSGLAQSCSWLLSIPTFIPDGGYIYEGGICEDELTMYRTEYENVFLNMCSILDKRLTLRRPYSYFTKWQIIEKLFEYDIYDCTWHCELPRFKSTACGDCVPCHTHRAALQYLASYGEGLSKFQAQRVLDQMSIADNQVKDANPELPNPDMRKEDDCQCEPMIVVEKQDSPADTGTAPS